MVTISELGSRIVTCGQGLFGQFGGRRLRNGFWWRFHRGFDSNRKGLDKKVDKFFCAGAVGVFVRIVLRYGEPDDVVTANGFRQRSANVGERHAAFGGNIDRRKFGICNEIGVEVDAVFARICVQMRERVLRGSGGRFALNIDCEHVAHRRFRKEFLLGRIETLDGEEIDVRLTHERRLAPEANKFGSAFADNAGDHHAINAAGRCCCGSIEVGVAVHPEEMELFIVTARGSEKSDGLRAIAAKNENERTTFYGDFGSCFQIAEAGDDFGNVAGAAMFVVVGKKARSTIAVVNDFETGGLEAFNKAGGAQSDGRFFAAGKKCGCARGRSNQGNLLLLTGDFDRQESLLEFALTGPGPRPRIPCCRPQKQKLECPNFTTTGHLGRWPLQTKHASEGGHYKNLTPAKAYATNLAARSRSDGGQLRRQRKTNVFANQIEIALIRKTVFGKA